MQSAGVSSRRADAVANRAHILEIAQSLFAERGLEMEMSEVAARAQLGVGTLYRHFANREDLLRAIILRLIEDTLTQYKTALASLAEDPRAALSALILAVLRHRQEYGPLIAILRDTRLAKLFEPSVAKDMCAQVLEAPRELIARGVECGVFRADLDQEMAAIMLLETPGGAFDFLIAESASDEVAQRLSHFLLTILERKPETVS